MGRVEGDSNLRRTHSIGFDFMESLARYLMLGGIILLLVGGGVFLAAKFGFPLGRLPGDIRVEGENGSFYFPLATSILVSVILKILINFISRLFNK